jgi:hypothetical protein
MVKVKLNEGNTRIMAKLAVDNMNAQLGIYKMYPADFTKDKLRGLNKRKSALIDCLERLEMNDLIKEIG